MERTFLSLFSLFACVPVFGFALAAEDSKGSGQMGIGQGHMMSTPEQCQALMTKMQHQRSLMQQMDKDLQQRVEAMKQDTPQERRRTWKAFIFAGFFWQNQRQ